jgi:hypothetical protein
MQITQRDVAIGVCAVTLYKVVETGFTRIFRKKPSKETAGTETSLLTPSVEDKEIFHEKFKMLFKVMEPKDKEKLIDAYLVIKREMRDSISTDLYAKKINALVAALFYAIDKKIDRTHQDRCLLSETARLIKEEALACVKRPSQRYINACQEIQTAILRGEDASVFSVKYA